MKDKIKYCLNNEVGGPNLQQIIGIGIAIAAAVAFYRFCKALHGWLGQDTDVIRDISPGEQEDSYQCS